MSTPSTSHIVARIRQQLAAGHGDEAILQSLADSGLSRPAAERFLASTRSSGRTPPASAAPRPATGGESLRSSNTPAPSMNASSGRALFSASLMTTFLVVSAGLSYLGHLPIRPRSLVLLGMSTLVAIWRAARHEETSPRRAVLAAVAVPLVGVVALAAVIVIWPRWQEAREGRDAERFAVAEKSAAARANAEQKRAAEDRARADRSSRDQDRLLAMLKNRRQPGQQCDAAIALGKTGRPDNVAVLEEVLRTGDDTVKTCAADGLVALGELLRMVAVYDEWARGDNPTLADAAIGGFASIGPAAATVALPHLAAALDANDWVRRSRVVDALTKLGPAARPLLERAARDERSEVREQALDGLDPSRVQRRWAAMRR